MCILNIKYYNVLWTCENLKVGGFSVIAIFVFLPNVYLYSPYFGSSCMCLCFFRSFFLYFVSSLIFAFIFIYSSIAEKQIERKSKPRKYIDYIWL